jgi:hypothetical protein
MPIALVARALFRAAPPGGGVTGLTAQLRSDEQVFVDIKAAINIHQFIFEPFLENPGIYRVCRNPPP